MTHSCRGFYDSLKKSFVLCKICPLRSIHRLTQLERLDLGSNEFSEVVRSVRTCKPGQIAAHHSHCWFCLLSNSCFLHVSQKCWSRYTTWKNCGWIIILYRQYQGWGCTVFSQTFRLVFTLLLLNCPSSFSLSTVYRKASSVAVLGLGQESHWDIRFWCFWLWSLRGPAALFQHVAKPPRLYRYAHKHRNAQFSLRRKSEIVIKLCRGLLFISGELQHNLKYLQHLTWICSIFLQHQSISVKSAAQCRMVKA